MLDGKYNCERCTNSTYLQFIEAVAEMKHEVAEGISSVNKLHDALFDAYALFHLLPKTHSHLYLRAAFLNVVTSTEAIVAQYIQFAERLINLSSIETLAPAADMRSVVFREQHIRAAVTMATGKLMGVQLLFGKERA